MVNSIYNLPDISFIGGSSFPIVFELYKDEMKTVPFNLDAGMSVIFSAIHYANRDYASPTFLLNTENNEDAIGYQQSEDGYNNILVIQIPFDITATLSGRFIYQITLFDEDGFPEILGQGIMDITRNIDSSTYISK